MDLKTLRRLPIGTRIIFNGGVLVLRGRVVSQGEGSTTIRYENQEPERTLGEIRQDYQADCVTLDPAEYAAPDIRG